jgi:hypothetical protein
MTEEVVRARGGVRYRVPMVGGDILLHQCNFFHYVL